VPLSVPSLEALKAATQRLSRELPAWRARQGRWVVAAVAGVLGGATALAVAVAPLAPDAAQLPSRVISEELGTVNVSAQLEALAALDLSWTHTEVTKSGASLEGTLRRLGVTDRATLASLSRNPALRRAVDGRGGRIIEATLGQRAGLQQLVVRMPSEDATQERSHFRRLTLKPHGANWDSQVELVSLGHESRMASGSIRSSLFAATDEALIPDPIATQMAEVFSTDIDFHRELRKGDNFSVVYETLTADGQPVPWNQGAGRLLAAEFVNNGRTHQAIWFEAQGKGAYFDPSGRSRKRQFLASPMAFSRVTSGFAMRFHPIHQELRAHKGVDYGAPTGTPVRTVGDGQVEFAGWQNGYGNTVVVRHNASQVTVYAHLSRVDVRKGSRVEQGQRVGAVGATGWATGPHLHFEFRENGVHKDPLKIAKAAQTLELDAKSRPAFAELARQVQTQLDVAETLGSRPRFE
jgi:murein DD-endopeptidase MepM/ murein hydrolase activator NlpD